ncbi:single-stranded DNA-binding protein [Ornithinimicrobium cerasi]|uniref:Single-stranded DNA-binding protein n=1 Tax=Ornithinimicrobium cerasi TaxID=2248773 RepID=A0A285VHF0_9MICO|nr:single-stranded DNA-binding protein [Ornithinimicrobium cerasi]SOC52606.1 single-strand DNA-binding protein [Ornithinimicrobium cerasi]
MVDSRMTIMGNLTRDPQLRIGSRSGEPFAVLAVAVNNRRHDKESGRWVTTGTTFFDVLCWRDMGANALLTFKKGDPVIAHGRFRLSEWSTEKGTRANATIDADAVGPDVSFGTASFAKGSVGYGLDRVDEYHPEEEIPDADRLEEYADENGEVSDEAAAELLAHEPAA